MSSWWKLKDEVVIDKSAKCKTLNNLTRRSAGNAGVKYIVVHYTANGHAGDKPSTAKNCCIYWNREKVGASADFVIDDSGIYRFNPNCGRYYSWHCGDGGGRYGITNANSIGIEVVSEGEAFTEKEKRQLRWLVRRLMAKYGVPASKVVRHWDASRKQCPKPYCGSVKKNANWAVLRRHLTGNY